MKKTLLKLANKYVITALIFAVWMMFFDQNDYKSQRQRKHDLQTTRDGIAYLNEEIAGMEKEHAGLISDPAKLEQYAREHYHMKKDNEDLFVIEK